MDGRLADQGDPPPLTVQARDDALCSAVHISGRAQTELALSHSLLRSGRPDAAAAADRPGEKASFGDHSGWGGTIPPSPT